MSFCLDDATYNDTCLGVILTLLVSTQLLIAAKNL